MPSGIDDGIRLHRTAGSFHGSQPDMKDPLEGEQYLYMYDMFRMTPAVVARLSNVGVMTAFSWLLKPG